MSQLLDNLARDFKHWVVVSDDENTRHEIIASLGMRDCSAVSSLEPGLGASTTSAENSIELLLADFKAMVMASGVVCSAPGGWSSFPYAATRISGAPLLFSTDVVNSPVWQLFHDYSKIPIRGTYWGVSGTSDFSKAVAGKTEQSQPPPSI